MKSIFIFLIMLIATSAYSQQKVNANEKVTLTGILTNKLFYGAPNFGENPETDAKEPSYILKLDKSILLKDKDFNGNDWIKITEIHVFDANRKIDLKPYNTKKVSIECTLAAAHTGHHHAPAITWNLYSIK